MGEKMSLEQVRDAMIEEKAWARGAGWPMAAGTLQRWADAIDDHLTQPAQAVDDETLLDVARRVGLRQQFPGVNATDTKFLLRAFMDAIALPSANGKEG